MEKVEGRNKRTKFACIPRMRRWCVWINLFSLSFVIKNPMNGQERVRREYNVLLLPYRDQITMIDTTKQTKPKWTTTCSCVTLCDFARPPWTLGQLDLNQTKPNQVEQQLLCCCVTVCDFARPPFDAWTVGPGCPACLISSPFLG